MPVWLELVRFLDLLGYFLGRQQRDGLDVVLLG